MNLACFYAFIASLFWGVGFIGSRYGLEEFGPLWVTSLRFIIASLAMAPVIYQSKARVKELFLDLKAPFICSFFLSGIICLQIAGLEFTTIAKSGFITILYAFFTPVICLFLYKKKIDSSYWVLLGIAFLGMLMLCDFSLSSLNFGDFLTLLCALFSTLHILAISKYAKTQNALVFNFKQMVFVSLITLISALIFEGSPTNLINGRVFLNTQAIGGLIFMGVFSTSIAFALQLKAQEKLSEHIASLIFLLESPLAAFLGFFVFAETMSFTAIAGCALVMISVAMIPLIKRVSFDYSILFKTRDHLLRPINFLLLLSLCIIL